jgi:hypothetical protein
MATVCRRFFVARKARLRGDMDVDSKDTIKSGIDELDGWTLEVTIPAITIRLTKPPDKA